MLQSTMRCGSADTLQLRTTLYTGLLTGLLLLSAPEYRLTGTGLGVRLAPRHTSNHQCLVVLAQRKHTAAAAAAATGPSIAGRKSTLTLNFLHHALSVDGLRVTSLARRAPLAMVHGMLMGATISLSFRSRFRCVVSSVALLRPSRYFERISTASPFCCAFFLRYGFGRRFEPQL